MYSCPKNKVILDNIIRAWSIINRNEYKKIICSISGGSDSNVMLDIVWKCDKDNKVDYVWFDTGLEYQATKEHLKFLENKYGIDIIKHKPIKPIPTSCKQYGVPFVSKYVTDMIQRLYKHNFKWQDIGYEDLCKEYPNCKGTLKWWCNENGENSSFNINRNKWLKEFLIYNPPYFDISNKCCKYAKKDVVHNLIKDNGYDLEITGVRKSEGGIRSTSYKNCFDNNDGSYDRYRPLFFYKDSDKEVYEKHYKIIHSKCYTDYGLKRTGCVGCPYGKKIENELQAIEKHEPKLFIAVNNIFGESYEYTRKYKEFQKQHNQNNL